jgi:hypothetical protein
MNTFTKTVAALTVVLVATAFTTVTTVSAEEAQKPVEIKTVKTKTSTAPNKLFKNRRGYYDRYNDTWVYFVR